MTGAGEAGGAAAGAGDTGGFAAGGVGRADGVGWYGVGGGSRLAGAAGASARRDGALSRPLGQPAAYGVARVGADGATAGAGAG